MVSQQTPKPALNLVEMAAVSNGASPSSVIDWPDPVAFTTKTHGPDVHIPDVLPASLAEYVEAVSNNTHTPELLALMYALSVLSTCVQKRFVVSPFSGYSETLSLWTVTVLLPSNRKSRVADLLREPLIEWEKERGKALHAEICHRDIEIGIAEKRIEQLKVEAVKAKDVGERNKLIAESVELASSLPLRIVAPEAFITDGTTEAVQKKLAEQGGRLALLNDEGGIFETLSGLYSDGKVILDVFLQGYSGGSVRVSRIGRSAHIDKAAIAIGLTVQPEIIFEMQDPSKRRFRTLGLLSRFLYAWPKSLVGSRDVRDVRPIPAEVRDRYFERVKILLGAEPEFDVATGEETPRMLVLSAAALERYFDFAQYIEDNQGEYGKYAHIQDWTGKLPGQMLRIAAVCHLYEYGTSAPVISEETINRAIVLARILIEHAEIVLSTALRVEPHVADARHLADWLKLERNAKAITANGFQVMHAELNSLGRFNKSEVKRLNDALAMLQSLHILSERQTLPTKKPTYFYYVNPKFFLKEEIDNGI